MNIKKPHNLACPIDQKPLTLQEKSLACENGHVFDIARQGYVNLLPVQHKRSRQPGDSKAMVVARAAFLNSGIYNPIAKKMAEVIYAQIKGAQDSGDQASNNKTICLMDAGCGEGYYLDYVFKYLEDRPGSSDLSFIGLDISKFAIVESAKRNKQITWIVGTNRQPPVEKASINIVLSVFGFHSFEGSQEVLITGGKLILVEPGPAHLQELREVIYSDVKKSPPPDLARAETSGFMLKDTQQLHFKTDPIDHSQINNLLIMTPHFYRASKEGREAASKLKNLELTVDVVIRILEKKEITAV
ncbi:putative RNA methyltransferase [Kaarinaea lacus]